MSKFAVKNYWPSLLLSLVLLVGIGICMRKLDCLEIAEVRALITIVFGSATSCLLLSFVWLIQRKPLNRPWPNQGLVLGRSALPSMNPRGSFDDPNYDDHHDHHRHVSTISRTELEQPPTYDDALIHSKPLDWHLIEKVPSEQRAHSSSRKISYIQLDVGQLLLSSSPPKYYELQFNDSDNMITRVSDKRIPER